MSRGGGTGVEWEVAKVEGPNSDAFVRNGQKMVEGLKTVFLFEILEVWLKLDYENDAFFCFSIKLPLLLCVMSRAVRWVGNRFPNLATFVLSMRDFWYQCFLRHYRLIQFFDFVQILQKPVLFEKLIWKIIKIILVYLDSELSLKSKNKKRY